MSERARTFTPPSWWLKIVQERVQNRRTAAIPGLLRMSQSDLQQRLREVADTTYHPGEISRCVSGEVVPQEMAIQVSEVLAIPPPWFVPISLDEAERFAQQRKLTRFQVAEQHGLNRPGLAERMLRDEVDPQLAAMKAGVGLRPKAGQTPPVKPIDGSSSKPKRGRVGRAG